MPKKAEEEDDKETTEDDEHTYNDPAEDARVSDDDEIDFDEE